MGNLLTFDFWFSSRPGALIPIMQKSFIVFVVVLFVLGCSFFYLKKIESKIINRKTRGRLMSLCFTNTFIGLLILFFTAEYIPFLSSRFWFLLWFVEIIIWLVLILREIKVITKNREENLVQKQYKQYIP